MGKTGGESVKQEDGEEMSTEAFEKVPDLESVSDSSKTNAPVAGTTENDGSSGLGQPAKVSVRCSSLGENGEMIINTIEVSTEELMSLGHLNAEEVEFVYSPNDQFQEEEVETLTSNQEDDTDSAANVKQERGSTGEALRMIDSNDSGVTTIRIINREPRLVIQATNEPRENVAQETQKTNTSNLTSTPCNDVFVTAADKPVASVPKRKPTPDTPASNKANVILASEMQGLEQQLPVIIKTATLAQQTVSAAIQGHTNTVTLGSKRSSSRPATVEVEVSEGTRVQLQKYYCQPSLCRVCLLPKDNLTSIFEDVTIDSKGLVENTKGSKAANKFHLLPALEKLLEIQVEYNDGLPNYICMECYDQVMNFSVYRKRIAIGQTKLNQILEQVKGVNTPTFIPSLGEGDISRTDIYKNPAGIIAANNTLSQSQYSHLVQRNISDRTWDKIFTLMSSIMGYKSGKLKCLEIFSNDAPYVSAFFCYPCNCIVHGAKDTFAQHYYDFHGVTSIEDILYPCDICGNSYPLNDYTGVSQSYYEHWLQHFFIHKCSFCIKKLPSARGLSAHIKSVHKHKNKAFVSEEEEREPTSKKSHLDPVIIVETMNVKSTNSHNCNESFPTQSSSMTNSSSEHDEGRPWKCDISGCHKRFKRKEVLITHKETVHLNIRKYECEICKDTFKSQSSKTVHMLRHKGEKNYECTTCSQKFFTANGLKSHTVKHQEIGTFSCNQCSKVFKRSSYLEDHQRTHTGETPFQCPVCDRAFRMKSNYFKHMRIHKRKNEVQ